MEVKKKKNKTPSEFDYTTACGRDFTLLAPTIKSLPALHRLRNSMEPYLSVIIEQQNEIDARGEGEISGEPLSLEQVEHGILMSMMSCEGLDLCEVYRQIENMLVRYDLILEKQRPLIDSRVIENMDMDDLETMVLRYLSHFILPLFLTDDLKDMEFSLLILMKNSKGGASLSCLSGISLLDIHLWFEALNKLSKLEASQMKKKR